MTLQEVNDQLKALTTELDALLASEAPTEEQADKAEELAAQVAQLEAKAVKLRNVETLKQTRAAQKSSAPVVATVAPAPVVTIGKDRADQERGAALTGLWLAGAYGNSQDAQKRYSELTGVEFRTHTMADDGKGGIFVPNEVSSYIIDLKAKYGAFRPNVRVENMGSETKTVHRFDNDITAYWGAEATAYTASDMTFSGVSLTARKLTALAVLTEELDMNSSVNLGARFAESVARQFAYKEDLAGFNGDGSSTYGNITGVRAALKNLGGTYTNTAGLVTAAGNAYSEVTLQNFVDAKNRLPEYARPGAKWYLSRTAFGATYERLAWALGGVTALEVTGSLGERILGYPVQFVEVMPTVEGNDQVFALFGSLDLAATMGDRQSVSVKQDLSTGFTTDTIYVKANEYVDIVVHDVGNYSATAADRVAGPIVGIITAGS